MWRLVFFLAGLLGLCVISDAQIINPVAVPVVTTWTPTLTGFLGTGLVATGVCQKNGAVSDCVVTITGTTVTATAGTSTCSTPFTPARNSVATVSVPTLISIGNGLMQTSSVLAMPTVAIGVSTIVVNFQVFTI